MPHFYIDTSDQEYFMRDCEGHEFADVEAAKTAAVDALPDMARETLPDGDSRTFIAVVRDDQGRTLVQATMSFGVTWMTPSNPPAASRPPTPTPGADSRD